MQKPAARSDEKPPRRSCTLRDVPAHVQRPNLRCQHQCRLMTGICSGRLLEPSSDEDVRCTIKVPACACFQEWSAAVDGLCTVVNTGLSISPPENSHSSQLGCGISRHNAPTMAANDSQLGTAACSIPDPQRWQPHARAFALCGYSLSRRRADQPVAALRLRTALVYYKLATPACCPPGGVSWMQCTQSEPPPNTNTNTTNTSPPHPCHRRHINTRVL